MQHIRVSDAERDRACAILREHYAVGRLDDQELSTRLAAAHTAVTWGDLNDLMYDLPALPGMPLAPAAYPPPPQPVAYAPPPVHYPQMPPPMPAPDPGRGYRLAAGFSFVLGFATFGIMWIPSVIFAILAARAKERGQRDPNTVRTIAAVTAAGLLAALVLLPAGFDRDDDEGPGGRAPMEMFDPAHNVVLEVKADQRSASAAEMVVTTDDEETTQENVLLPIRRPIHVDSLDDLSLTVTPDGDVRLTCRIIVDDTEIKESLPKRGEPCKVTYDD
ncbi:DUF1707 SHOCT-like domain-containing protein [Herbidospora cretacea]|uniref:DUF1707 SHOCT-like domain-containing protein n=1 Tax=Herbidospora cretacea TaxID=28444 RepID=UPI000773A8F3|nr:DUF1707 domain-containing protein [Herbidospora cretacea]